MKTNSLTRAGNGARKGFRVQIPTLANFNGENLQIWNLSRIPSAVRRGRVQGHGGANEVFQCLLVNLVAFVEVDGAPHLASRPELKRPEGLQRGAPGERHPYGILVGLAGADRPVVGPDHCAQRIGRLYPLYFLDGFGVGLRDQSADAGKHLSAPVA